MTERYGGWCESSTGRKLWIMDFRKEDVCLETIAHALAYKCRFNGHCSKFFSVGAHSINVSRHPLLRESPQLQMEGLMHDCSEAVLPDVPTPMKPYLYVQARDPLTGLQRVYAYSDYEDQVQQTMFDALGLRWTKDSRVKVVDREALRWEAENLLPSRAKDWSGPKIIDGWWYGPEPLLPRYESSPGLIKEAFLERYYELLEKILDRRLSRNLPSVR